MNEFDGLPGGDLVAPGFADLRGVRESVPAFLVSVGAPRLRALGVDVPAPFADPVHRLDQRLHECEGDGAHSRYNALLRRLVSFERALACAR
jgi:hypothetical protein